MTRLMRLVALACVITGVLATAPIAAASRPLVVHVPFASFTDTELCAFPIEMSFEGEVRVAVYLDRNGQPIREIDTFPNFVVTFEHDGNALTTHGPGPGILTFNPDGSLATLTIVGMSANITLPGEGRLLFDVGRVVLDAAGNVLEEHGVHQIWGTASADAFCAALA